MPLQAGAKLGPYEIVAPAGAGGMGEVYRARDSRLGRDVAVKVLPESFANDPERLRRFDQEARVIAALNHPNILAIHDTGNFGETRYLVTEMLEGETLRDRLRSGALPLRKATDYALQITRGLAAAHDKGIAHRDLKPENIFLTRDGHVKILDFGLAKLSRAESAAAGAESHTMSDGGHTTPGTVIGTAGYMSPEQVRGQVVDHRSDIFSFGAILYEMLSGQRAFKGETPADTMSSILKEEPPELASTTRNLPPAVDRIVRHCLEKTPEQRFQSARDIAFGLEELSGISTTSAAVAQIKVAKSRRKLGIVVGTAIAALVLVAMGLQVGERLGRIEPPVYQQVTFRLGSIGNARFTPDGSIVYDALWEGAPRQIYMARTDTPGERELGMKDAQILAISKNGELAIQVKQVQLSGYMNYGTLARAPLSGGSPREVLDDVQFADWAPNGDDLAVTRFIPETGHWRLEYPAGKVLLETTNWISHPKISPDGKSVAFADHQNPGGDDQGAVALIGADGKERILSAGWIALQGIAWSADGSEVWFSASKVGSDWQLHGVTPSGRFRTISTAPGGMMLEDVRGDKVLVAVRQVRQSMRGLAPGDKQERELGWFGWSLARDITPDGKLIAFEEDSQGGGPDYSTFVRAMDGSPPVRLSDGGPRAISPDGKWVVTLPAKGGPLNLVPTGAGQAGKLTHDSVAYGRVRFFPDGKHLIATGIEPGHGIRDYLIDVATGDSRPITPEGVRGAALSPDGKRVAVVDPAGKWQIWAVGGGMLQPIPAVLPTESVRDWSPDGQSVYVETQHLPGAKLDRVVLATGKREPWKTFEPTGVAGLVGVAPPSFSRGASAYVYTYSQELSQAYVVTGLK